MRRLGWVVVAVGFLTVGFLTVAPGARAQQPDVSKPCTATPGTPGCGETRPQASPGTGAQRPGSTEMQTSPTGMMTDSARQPSPPDPKTAPQSPAKP